MSLDPARAAVRLGVRRELLGVDEPIVLVACSGGADSLALLSAARVEGHQRGLSVIGVTVDHGLQEGSAERARDLVGLMARMGVDETVSVRVQVESTGQGPEAAAREARYAVLAEVAQRVGSATMLLGHTRDDQAETVLLGLTRGSGGRSLAGMRRGFDVFHRPLLDVTRAQTEAACRAEGLEWWSDPHNEDPRYTRSRVRHRVLPVLEEELGPGVAASLARTADLLREDSQGLDEIADRVHGQVVVDGSVDCGALQGHPRAVVLRVARLAALEAGCPPSELFRVHVVALAGMVEGDEGAVRHKQVQLPGRVTASRDGDLLTFRPTAVAG